MKNLLFTLALTASLAISSQQSQASLIEFSLDPSSTVISPPQNVFIDINMSGLQSGNIDNLLGNWSMQLIYDPAILVPLLVPPSGWGGHLGDIFAGETVGGVDTTTAGVVDFFEVSLLPDVLLDPLQRDPVSGNLLDSFTLATIGFYAPPIKSQAANMQTIIRTANIVLGDAYGNPISDSNGQIIPILNTTLTLHIPAPNTYLLWLTGIIVLLGLTKKSELEKK